MKLENTLRLLPSAFLLALTTLPAHAQPDRIATARELAIEGIDRIEAGDCARGVPLLERAERLHHGVVHLQYLARCHVGAGRLVAATELWRRMLREPIDPHATPAVHRAMAEARDRLPKTLPKLARTTLRTHGANGHLEVTIDGRKVAPELLNTALVVDPGPHRLVARAPGFDTLTRDWIVKEGESSAIDLVLRKTSPADAAPQITDEDGTPAASPPWTTLGWVSVGTGGAALVAGVVTLLTRDNRRESLREKCPAGTCTPSEFAGEQDLENQKQSIRTLTDASNVLFVASGVLLVGGGLLVWAGQDAGSGDPAAAVRLEVAPSGVRATARF